MSLVTANDVGALSASINHPLRGVWSADIALDQVDADGFDEGADVTIKSGDYSWSGVVAPKRSGDFLDSLHVRVLGGKGGMGKAATARSYAQPGAFVRDVVNALMQDAGETLSSTSDQGLLGTNLVAWSIVAGHTVAGALEALLDIVAPNMTWRVLPDGTVWIGADSWSSATGTYEILEEDPAHGAFELGVDAPFLSPGTTLDGVGKLNRVEHELSADRVRTHVLVDVEAGARGMADSVRAMVEKSTAPLDYYAFYDATVKSQSGDGKTVDVTPADTRLAGMSRVELRHGLPGCKVLVAPGAILRIGWDNGDPRKPFAALWNGGESITAVEIGSPVEGVVLKADFDALITALQSATAGGNALTFIPAAPLPTVYASNVFKVQR